MADTTYVDYVAPAVNAEWLNEVNVGIHRANSSTFGTTARTLVDKLTEIVSVEDFSSISAAVTAIGSDTVTLTVNTSISLAADLTIPANIHLQFSNAGFITITGSKTLTINGPFTAPLKQIFNTPTCTAGSGVGPVLATITNNVIFGGDKKPVVHPIWFGAGGGADDWQALQGALWCVTSSSPAVTVQLEEGVTYTVSKSPVIDTNYMRLLGAPGAWIKRKNTTTADTMNCLDTGHEGRYTWGPSYPILGVEINGVGFDGNKANNTVGADDTYDNVISALYLQDSKIINNHVKNGLRFGVAVSNSNSVKVYGNTVTDCDENGLYAETGARIQFTGNLVKDCSTSTWNMGAISMSNITNSAIASNVVSGGYDGIYIRNVCDKVTVANNSVSGPTRYGIWVKDESDAYTAIPINISITGNTVSSTDFPLFCELARKLTATGNTLHTTTAANCIKFRNGEDQTFTGNILTGASGDVINDGGGNSRTFVSDVAGTWTPVITGATSAGTGTYTTQVGNYSRQGNRIRVSGTITQTAHTGTGQMRVSLPFATSASDNTLLDSTIYNTAITGHMDSLVVGGQAYARCHQNNNGTLTDFAVPAGAATVYFSGEYEI